MERVVIQYFQNLFCSSKPNTSDMDRILEDMPTSLNGNHNAILSVPFTREEIKGVVNSMHPTRRLGLTVCKQFFIKNTGTSSVRILVSSAFGS